MSDDSIDISFVEDDSLMVRARGIAKTFMLHTQGGQAIAALNGVDLDLRRGECVALVGSSGAGKSTLLRCLYGNYLASAGSIAVRDESNALKYVTLTGAHPHDVLRIRRELIGYVSQFLRVIPRVPALELVAEPLLSRGIDGDEARHRARHWLARLGIPERLWQLAPATFSGGEQQRVNIARGLIAGHPVMLLDEPTASLDATNRAIVAEVIDEARRRGTAMIGIFHDEATRAQLCTRRLELEPLSALAAG